MGYTTQFKGELKFTTELTARALAKLQKILGEDCRDHKEWEGGNGLYRIDLELTEEFDGLRWDGTEKTYAMTDLVNVVIREMRKEFPSFGLCGQLNAQGEELEDRWVLEIGEDGFAHKRKVVITGKRVQCPNCEHHFILEG